MRYPGCDITTVPRDVTLDQARIPRHTLTVVGPTNVRARQLREERERHERQERRHEDRYPGRERDRRPAVVLLRQAELDEAPADR